MNMEITAKIPLLSDSDNSLAETIEITKYEDTMYIKLDNRELQLSYEHFSRISKLFAQE